MHRRFFLFTNILEGKLKSFEYNEKKEKKNILKKDDNDAQESVW
jgi:hypothetical protein